MSSPLIAKVGMSYSSTSAAATSSWVESGFEAQQDDVRAAGLERAHQVGGLGGHVQAGGDAVAGERLLPLEALADRLQDRHLPVGPLDPPDALRRQGKIFHVVSLRRSHVVLSVFGRGAV